MAEKKPLVLKDGKFKEMAAGETIPLENCPSVDLAQYFNLSALQWQIVDNKFEPTVPMTPNPPDLVADDITDTLTASHVLGISEIVMSVNNGSYIPYSPISVGNVARASGYWKFKIKANANRNESSIVESPAFTVSGSGGNAELEGFSDTDPTLLTNDGIEDPFKPPLIGTNRTYKINGDGYGQGQSGDQFVVGSYAAFQYKANSANTAMVLTYERGNLGNYQAFKILIDGDAVVKAISDGSGINVDLPIQPINEQFVVMYCPLIAATRRMIVYVFDVDGLTLIDTQTFEIIYTNTANSVVEWDTIGGAAVINKPQVKDTVKYAP